MFGGASTAAAAAASRAMADSAAGSLHAADVAEPKRETSPEAKAKSSDDSEVCCKPIFAPHVSEIPQSQRSPFLTSEAWYGTRLGFSL